MPATGRQHSRLNPFAMIARLTMLAACRLANRTLLALSIAAVLPAAGLAQDATAGRPLQAADINALPLRDGGAVVAYGSDSLQFGELRLPPGPGPHPLVVVIHGGCWYSPYASSRNSAPLAEALTDAGVATWNIEYRRYDQPGGGWPGTFTDVAQATDFVRMLAQTHALDTTRMVAIGHSAGAQLAAWLPTRSRLSPESPLYAKAPMALQGVVSLGGVMDMAEFQTRQQQTCGNPAVESVLGGLPATVPERYAAVSPSQRLPLGVPHVHVSGSRDRIAHPEAVEAFATAARAQGDEVSVVTLQGLGHHDVMAPISAGGQAAIDAVRQLLGITPRQ